MRVSLRTITLTGTLAFGGILGIGLDSAHAQGARGSFGQRGNFAARPGQGQAGNPAARLGQGQVRNPAARPGQGQGQAGKGAALGANSRLGPVYNPAKPESFKQQLGFRQGYLSHYTGKKSDKPMTPEQQKGYQAGQQHAKIQQKGRGR